MIGGFHLLVYSLTLKGLGNDLVLNSNYLDWGPFSLSFILVIDLYSFLFSRFILLISCVVLYYRLFYIDIDPNVNRFLILVLMFVGSMLLLVYFPSLLGIILGWDGLGVSSFILVIFYNNVSSLRSGMLTIYVNRLGDIFFIFSFFFLFCVGVFTVDIFLVKNYVCFYFFVLLAGITKRAQVPFSSWLPAAMSAPTPVSSLVHSSTLVTAGVYLFIRFFYLVRLYVLRSVFFFISLLTFFSAGLIACVERDLKKLVAMSTLRQLGLIIFSFCLGNFFLTFFHIVSHALFKSLLFLTCGFVILVRFSLQDIRFMGRKVLLRKRVFIMLFISVIRLVGVFFLRGFFSKDLVIDLSARENLAFITLCVFIFSCVLSVLYSLKFLYEAFSRYQIGFTQLVGSSLKLVVFFIGLLFLWSTFFGKSLFFFFFDGEFYMHIKWQKLIGGIVLLFGLFFLALGTKVNLLLLAVIFVREIFFLNWFLGGFFSAKLFYGGVLLVGERYWLEKFGASGVGSFFFLIYRGFASNRNFFIACFFFLSFLLVFILILPVSL